MTFTITDWSRSNLATLDDVAGDTTIGELVDEVTDAMNLPRHTPYSLVDRRQRKLPASVTVAAGIEDGEEMQVADEVSAG